jgi:hypothetical protein
MRLMWSSFLAGKAPEPLLGRLLREKHVEDLLGLAKPSRMPTNLARRLAKQQEGLREE